MPLNEAQSFQVSELTEKEQHEAMVSLYGLPTKSMSTTSNPMLDLIGDLTLEQRVRLRQSLDEIDRKHAENQVFDLAKPPVPPYVYQEFPFLMYHHGTRKMRAARSQEERELMIAEGWSTQPFSPDDDVAPALSAAERAAAEEIDGKLVKRRK